MRDIAPVLRQWFDGGTPFGLATVVATTGSAAREVGAVMAVGPDGQVLGGVSGGCVESAVYDAALAAAHGGPGGRLHFAESDDDPFAPALTCGGEITVAVDRVDRTTRPHFGTFLARLEAGSSVCEIVSMTKDSVGHLVLTPDECFGGPDHLRALAQEMLSAGVSGVRESVFVRSFPPRPRLIVFGSLELADAVAHAATFVGYHVVVCDAREVFATAQRLPHADEVIVAWPHEYLAQQWDSGTLDASTALCVLTHDAKFDEPLLEVALATPCRYIGVLGSRRTHDDRVRRLLARGVPPDDLRRLSSPIGLDLGGRSPQETALSIVAEIVAAASDRVGGRLRNGHGAIHSGSAVRDTELSCAAQSGQRP